jgi:hypothetical protein
MGVRNINAQGICTVYFDQIDIPNPDLNTRSKEVLYHSPADPRAPPVRCCLARKIILGSVRRDACVPPARANC